MKHTILSNGFKVIVFLFVLFLPRETGAQSLSIRPSVGFAHLPLSDWSNFFGSIGGSYYQKNNPNLYYALCFAYNFSETQTITFGTELIRTSASLSGNPVVTWKFQGIPISLGYEHKLASLNDYASLFVGAGISYFMSQVEAYDYYFHHTLKRTGYGYGIHGSFGLLSKITNSLSLISQVRYRYSDGMAFSDKKEDIKVEFTGVDFSTGLSLTF